MAVGAAEGSVLRPSSRPRRTISRRWRLSSRYASCSQCCMTRRTRMRTFVALGTCGAVGWMGAWTVHDRRVGLVRNVHPPVARAPAPSAPEGI